MISQVASEDYIHNPDEERVMVTPRTETGRFDFFAKSADGSGSPRSPTRSAKTIEVQ